jgi:hypothetical protein
MIFRKSYDFKIGLKEIGGEDFSWNELIQDKIP